MKKSMVLGVFLLLVLSLSAVADEDVWTPEKMMLERSPGSTTFSPDGKWIAYTVREAVMEEEKSEYLTHIWLSTVDGSRSFQLTQGDKSCSSPTWSPCGKWIAFSSRRSGKQNIWIIRPDGGEARQLTDVKTSVGSFKFSPDGKWIALLMTDPDTEEEEKARKARNDARIVDTDFKYTHIYRFGFNPSCTDKPEPERITEGDFEVNGFDWAPDGGSIVFTHQNTPLIDDWRTAEISLVPAEGGEIKPLVRNPGYDSGAVFSPDGKTIAFISDRGKDHWARHWRICLVPAAGGDVTVLPETRDSRPFLLEWAYDSNGVYYEETQGTSTYLFLMPADGSPLKRITSSEGVTFDLDVSEDGSMVAFAWEDLESPPEIYVSAVDGGDIVKISNINSHLPDLPFAKSEVISWKSFDGLEIEGILHYPLGYEEGKRYPLLLNVHGGPAGVYIRTFTAGSLLYPYQAFSAKGFFVLRPNPRGSSGYGWEFRFANTSDWGYGDYKDVMAGVDYLIDKGLADPDRLGVMGWSYGGFMTSWVITQTDRFKAAAVGAGVTNLVSFTGTTDIVGFIPSYFEGELWERDEVYRQHSAMFQVGNAVTPTLILHGENDARVPIGQGYELYNALKRKGVEVQMVVYPRTPHGPREPKLLLDAMRRHVDWFSGRLLEN